jgi:hypothetical protein
MITGLIMRKQKPVSLVISGGELGSLGHIFFYLSQHNSWPEAVSILNIPDHSFIDKYETGQCSILYTRGSVNHKKIKDIFTITVAGWVRSGIMVTHPYLYWAEGYWNGVWVFEIQK